MSQKELQKRQKVAERIRKAALELNVAIYEGWREGLIIRLNEGTYDKDNLERSRPYINPSIFQPLPMPESK